MSKKKILIPLVGLSLIIGIIIYVQSKRQNVQTPVPSTSQNQSPSVKGNNNVKQYSDPSGFSFSLPKNLTVSAKQSTDRSVYSDLQILAPQVKGAVTIKVVASNLATVEAYFKNNKLVSKDTKVDKLKLADLDARRFTTGSQINTVALDKGVLFTIVTDSSTDESFWEDVNDTVVKSFAFAPPDNQVTSGSDQGSSDDGGVMEEEEVVE